jgi:hypothetical protein
MQHLKTALTYVCISENIYYHNRDKKETQTLLFCIPE